MQLSRLYKAIIIFVFAFVVSAASLFVPVLHNMEEDTGLGLLFAMRGERTPPEEVIVVSIDLSSSRYFKLPNLTSKWPRKLHALLLDRLRQAGARVILFDVHFRYPREKEQDEALARAIRQSGNVVLFAFLKKQVLNTVDQFGRVSSLVIDELIAPVASFARGAAAIVPNPLPKVPVKVSQFWKFIPEAGDSPTLPSTGFQLYVLGDLPAFMRLVEKSLGYLPLQYEIKPEEILSQKKIVSLMKKIHQLFASHPELKKDVKQRIDATAFSAREKKKFYRLLSLYSGEASQYINYYGPPRSIKTIPVYKVMDSDDSLAQLKDKLVFVGFSERRQWEQQDGFYTVYSNPDGLDISGVEITATAAANLLNNDAVRPLVTLGQLGIFALLSLLIAIFFMRLRGLYFPLTMLSLAGIYYLLVQQLFNMEHIWLPLATPVLIVFPLSLVLGMVWNFQEVSRERKNIQRVFGYYLPENEINRLVRDAGGDVSGGQLMHGICLSTDAQQYTQLSERLPPQQLTAFINEYYEVIFKPVKTHKGIISDVVGDSVMALWASPVEHQEYRKHAVQAAMEILENVAWFNSRHPGFELPTRIGLHYGAMVLGNVGAVDHYEYRAVGDIVNASSRIEGMNKYLGTRLLVSEEVMQDLQGFVCRDVGRFTLKGKTVPLQLFEVMARQELVTAEQKQLKHVFSQALLLFQQGLWDDALEQFSKILESFENDGPALFYMDYCLRYKNSAPTIWHGVISMSDK